MKISRELHEAARKLGLRSYTEYLKTHEWKNFKIKYSRSVMPNYCLCCNREEFIFMNVFPERVGLELFTDVIPLCFECHDNVYKAKMKNRRSRIDHLLKSMNNWTNEERIEKFKLYIIAWEKPSSKIKISKIRYHNDYYKITNDIKNFRNYFREGYSLDDLAKIYGVDVKYIVGYITKYPEQVS